MQPDSDGSGVMPVRVLVGEDNYLAREGIERILNQTDDVTHLGTCADLDTLRAAVADAAPEVVLTDIRMPPTHTDEGLRLAAELRETHPDVGVVILTQHAEPAYAMALFARGHGPARLSPEGAAEQPGRAAAGPARGRRRAARTSTPAWSRRSSTTRSTATRGCERSRSARSRS